MDPPAVPVQTGFRGNKRGWGSGPVNGEGGLTSELRREGTVGRKRTDGRLEEEEEIVRASTEEIFHEELKECVPE